MEPSPETQAVLDSILSAVEAATAVNTHVAKPTVRKDGTVTRQGGRLLASLHRNTTLRRSSRRVEWKGEMSLGEGVRYAKYETGDRRRGTRPDWLAHPSHDPYDGLEMYYPAVDRVLGEIG